MFVCSVNVYLLKFVNKSIVITDICFDLIPKRNVMNYLMLLVYKEQ